MKTLLFFVMVAVVALAACSPPVAHQCACERAQGECGMVSEDMGVGLPDYPGC